MAETLAEVLFGRLVPIPGGTMELLKEAYMPIETHMVPILGLSFGGRRALSLEHGLKQMEGIVKVWVNPAKETAFVTLDPERILMRDVVGAIEECGYEAGVCIGP